MSFIEEKLSQAIQEACENLYQKTVDKIILQATTGNFEGSHTLVTFQLAKSFGQSPEQIAQAIGQFLLDRNDIVSKFNVANKGFLNLTISDSTWLAAFNQMRENPDFGQQKPNNQRVMVEFSSPNTNKPLHLGHLRNIFLGWSVAKILEAAGYQVFRTCIVNDRGIHICKSMLAYQKYGKGETPESSGTKGDHLVGKYYVEFDKRLKLQIVKYILEAFKYPQKMEAESSQIIQKISEKEFQLSNEYYPFIDYLENLEILKEYPIILNEIWLRYQGKIFKELWSRLRKFKKDLKLNRELTIQTRKFLWDKLFQPKMQSQEIQFRQNYNKDLYNSFTEKIWTDFINIFRNFSYNKYEPFNNKSKEDLDKWLFLFNKYNFENSLQDVKKKVIFKSRDIPNLIKEICKDKKITLNSFELGLFSNSIKVDIGITDFSLDVLLKELEKRDTNLDAKEKLKSIVKTQNEIKELEALLNDYVKKKTKLTIEAENLLIKWEQNDPETVSLWKKMNGWVYAGFNETYQKVGVKFDKIYYESDTYILGKDIVQEGLEKGVFYRADDSSVWVDLTADKLDKKIILRSNGTSVYITQDLGTAELKYADFQIDKSIYVVGNEQDYHFKVLFKILEKLGRSYAPGLYHLSYGMVELPQGKMKSREGTVVDADDLIAEMIKIAKEKTDELGKTAGFSAEELQKLYHIIGTGAIKYFLLKVDPKKTMLFNPEESVDFQGDAAPYIQFNYARINSIGKKATLENINSQVTDYQQYTDLHSTERELIIVLNSFPNKIIESATNYVPSVLAQYVYEVAKSYSKFYTECSIFNAETSAAVAFRVALSITTAQVIKKAMDLLGIDVPERM
jgi:arginyl-tRNA synthetase